MAPRIAIAGYPHHKKNSNYKREFLFFISQSNSKAFISIVTDPTSWLRRRRKHTGMFREVLELSYTCKHSLTSQHYDKIAATPLNSKLMQKMQLNSLVVDSHCALPTQPIKSAKHISDIRRIFHHIENAISYICKDGYDCRGWKPKRNFYKERTNKNS